jgi:hypothetical protein
MIEMVVDTLRNAGVHSMGSRSYYDMAAFAGGAVVAVYRPESLS